MFDALSKELYSIKQGPGENVAEFGVQLLQQVQILQSEYLGRIQQERMEEMKRDPFYEGLNPKYQWMLAHKVDGEHPARYSDLLLAAWKLERWAEVRDSLLLKAASMGGPNVTNSQTSGNLFPSQKLKGNQNSTTRLTMVESNGVAEDSGTKEEVEFSDGEDFKTLSGIKGADQSLGYIIHFANTGKLSQKKNWNCFGGGSLTILWKIAQRISVRLLKK